MQILALGLIYIAIVVAMFVGWVMNIIDIIGGPTAAEYTGLFIARVLGVIVFPLGAVLGYV